MSVYSINIAARGEEIVYDEDGKRYCVEISWVASRSSCAPVATGQIHSLSCFAS